MLRNSLSQQRWPRPMAVLSLSVIVLTPALHCQTIHEAVKSWDLDKVRACLNGGADVNQKDRGGYTPLHYAAGHCKLKLKEVPGKETTVGETTYKAYSQVTVCSLEIISLLLSKGANIDGVDAEGKTALHLAASLGALDAVDLLVSRGANLGIRDQFGNTALDYATLLRKGDVAERLKKAEQAKAEGAEVPAPTSQPSLAKKEKPGAKRGTATRSSQGTSTTKKKPQ